MSQRRTSSPFAGANFLLERGLRDRIRLAWRLYRDPRVASKLMTAVPLLTMIYVLSPVDLLPDLLLGLGQVDDIGMIGLALLFVTRVVPMLAPSDVLEEHLAAMGLRDDTRDAGQGTVSRPVVEAEFRVKP